MAHPHRAEAVDGHNKKLREMTRDYGEASGDTLPSLSTTPSKRVSGPSDVQGYGLDHGPSRGRLDRVPRRQHGGKVTFAGKDGGPTGSRKRGGHVGKGTVSGHDGGPSGSRADGGSVIQRAHGGRAKHKGSTHVNVIVAPQGGAGAGAGAPGMHPPMPPMGGPPPMPPPHPPMAGGPPGMPPGMGAGPPPPGLPPPGMIPPHAAGGRVSGRKDGGGVIEHELKEEGLKRASGGHISVPHLTGGSKSGLGRLQKNHLSGKKPSAGPPQAV